MSGAYDWVSILPVLRRVAEADETTLIVGAGTSAESGLPDWETLLVRMLTRAARRKGLSAQHADTFAQWTIRTDGFAASGAVAKAMLGGDFRGELRDALYEDVGDDPAPGEMAKALARLRLAFEGTRSEFVTTNYDPLASLAIREVLGELGRSTGTRPKVRVVASDDAQGDGEIVVRHAHGYLPPKGGAKGEVVLSEADYHLMQDDKAWQEAYFRRRLTDSTCLFAGSSLTDPNLLRYLWRTGGSPRHIAVFARQQDAERYEQVDPSVASAREAAAASRWQAMGVVPLLVDHYSQIAQVISEIARLRTLGTDYVPFPDRLAAWDAALRRDALTTRPGPFITRQASFRALLMEVLRGVEQQLVDVGLRQRSRERLHAALWVYRPREDALTNWAASDREWRDPRTLQPVPVTWSSDFVAVLAFCRGSVVERSTADQAATRWNHVVGAPVILNTPDLGRLPVGVLTLASTEPRERSVLHRAMPVLRNTFLPRYLPLIADVLSP